MKVVVVVVEWIGVVFVVVFVGFGIGRWLGFVV